MPIYAVLLLTYLCIALMPPALAAAEISSDAPGRIHGALRKVAEPRRRIEDAVRMSALEAAQSLGISLSRVSVEVTLKPLAETGRHHFFDVDLRLESDLPQASELLRLTRRAAMSSLEEMGYNPHGIPSEDSAEPGRPYVRLSVLAEYQMAARLPWYQKLEPQPVLTLFSLLGLSAMGLAWCWFALKRMLRLLLGGARPAAAKGQAAPRSPPIQVPGGPEVGLPPLPQLAYAGAAYAVDASVLPLVPPPPPSDSAPAPLGGKTEDLPPLPAPATSSPLAPALTTPQTAPGPAHLALIQAFQAMPFDKAVRALAAFDASQRAQIIARLGLDPVLQRRIEQVLATEAR